MKIIDRYIYRQLFMPFLIGVATFAVIMLGDAARQLGSILFGMKAPVGLILKYLAFHAPNAIVWSMPVGTVVAVAMTCTSLKNHGEMDAMRTGGASILRICMPMLVVGLILSGAALAMSEYIVPPASRMARETFASMTMTQPVVREQFNVYFRDDEGRFFYIGHMDAAHNKLEKVAIWTEDKDHNITGITAANWAELDANVWVLHEGKTVQLGQDGQSVLSMERFGTQSIRLTKALQDYYTGQRRDTELSGMQLQDLIDTIGQGGRDTHKMQVKLHFKYSIPLACFIFALIAAPIAIRFASYGSFVGVVVAILVVFLYNGVRSWTLAFGLAGMLDPFIAGWSQNIIFGAIGIILLLRSK